MNHPFSTNVIKKPLGDITVMILNFRFIIEINRFYETKRLEIHVRRNYPTRSGSAVIWFRLMFKILTSRIMKLLGWFTASW